MRWLFTCSSCDGTGKTQHYKLYHGTSQSTAAWINLVGFKPSRDGMFGPGVYVTGDWGKAKWFAQSRSEGIVWNSQPVVLVLDVDVGKCKTHNARGCEGQRQNGCSCKDWIGEGFDSQYVPAGEGPKREETVLKRGNQVIILSTETV